MSLKVILEFGVRSLNSKYSNISFSKAITNFINSRSVSTTTLKTIHVHNNSFLTSQKWCQSSVPSFLNSQIRCLASSADLKLLKKRSHKKRYSSEVDPENMEEGYFTVFAFATAKEYNLEQLKMALLGERLYLPQKLTDTDLPDVLFATAKYNIGLEPRQLFFFRDGSAVFWNFTELETSNVLAFLKNFEEEPYSEKVINREKEIMKYKYLDLGKRCHLKESTFFLSREPDNFLEKYTFSNAMTQSVKLGVWENTLDSYADSLAHVTEVLEKGIPIKMTRAEVLRKAGALFALRHHINLDSDLLDTPDFYWDRAELETLYGHTISYFSLARRTRVLNEKLSHCAELVELVGAQLSDRHHVRLEWMIIILIMVEVGFETLHFAERYLTSFHEQ